LLIKSDNLFTFYFAFLFLLLWPVNCMGIHFYNTTYREPEREFPVLLIPAPKKKSKNNSR